MCWPKSRWQSCDDEWVWAGTSCNTTFSHYAKGDTLTGLIHWCATFSVIWGSKTSGSTFCIIPKGNSIPSEKYNIIGPIFISKWMCSVVLYVEKFVHSSFRNQLQSSPQPRASLRTLSVCSVSLTHWLCFCCPNRWPQIKAAFCAAHLRVTPCCKCWRTTSFFKKYILLH